MRYNTFNRMLHTHTAMLIKFVIYQDPATGIKVRQYYDSGEKIHLKLYTGRPGAARPVAYTEKVLEPFERLQGVYDAGGKPLLGDGGFGYQVVSVAPVVDPFGFSGGMSYGLLRIQDMFKEDVVQDDETNTNKVT